MKYTLKETILWYPLYIMAIVAMYAVGMLCIVVGWLADMRSSMFANQKRNS
jgi:hypothetical protein